MKQINVFTWVSQKNIDKRLVDFGTKATDVISAIREDHNLSHRYVTWQGRGDIMVDFLDDLPKNYLKSRKCYVRRKQYYKFLSRVVNDYTNCDIDGVSHEICENFKSNHMLALANHSRIMLAALTNPGLLDVINKSSLNATTLADIEKDAIRFTTSDAEKISSLGIEYNDQPLFSVDDVIEHVKQCSERGVNVSIVKNGYSHYFFYIHYGLVGYAPMNQPMNPNELPTGIEGPPDFVRAGYKYRDYLNA